MAKQLSMGQISSILTLHQSGHSNRKIAKLLGVHRETVAKYIEAAGAVPAKPDHRVRPGPTSVCEPFPVGLYGLEASSGVSSRLVFLVEGPFDAIALDHHLRSLKARDRYDILAVPGANTFKPEWAKRLDGRKVRITVPGSGTRDPGSIRQAIALVCRTACDDSFGSRGAVTRKSESLASSIALRWA